jgi:hypothetical protein
VTCVVAGDSANRAADAALGALIEADSPLASVFSRAGHCVNTSLRPWLYQLIREEVPAFLDDRAILCHGGPVSAGGLAARGLMLAHGDRSASLWELLVSVDVATPTGGERRRANGGMLASGIAVRSHVFGCSCRCLFGGGMAIPWKCGHFLLASIPGAVIQLRPGLLVGSAHDP